LYLEEPNLIWTYRNCSRYHDELNQQDASDKVSKYIRKRFSAKLKNSGKLILLEKTPANSLRLPFVKTIFSQARFIFLERDVSEIALSAECKWVSEVDNNTKKIYGDKKSHKYRQFTLQVKKFLDSPLVDWPFYAGKILTELAFLVLGVKRKVWGPRYKGMAGDLDKYSIGYVCHKQAEICIEKSRQFRDTLPEERYIIVDYSLLKKQPDLVKEKVFHFIGLS
jgi:hypothetical protein